VIAGHSAIPLSRESTTSIGAGAKASRAADACWTTRLSWLERWMERIVVAPWRNSH
jgi:hypothetical protein